jgi:hypothetical protein
MPVAIEDLRAARAARDPLFPFLWVDIPCDSHRLLRCEIGRVFPLHGPDIALAAAMLTMKISLGAATTLWLDVRSPSIPQFIGDAIARCHGAGWGIVLTHGNTCSHSPDSALSQVLVSQLHGVNRAGGVVWHPLENALVPSRARGGRIKGK